MSTRNSLLMNDFFTNYISPIASEINFIIIITNLNIIITYLISYNVKLMRFVGSSL